MKYEKNLVVMVTIGFGWSPISRDDGIFMTTYFEEQGIHYHGFLEGGRAVRIALVPGIGRVRDPSTNTHMVVG